MASDFERLTSLLYASEHNLVRVVIKHDIPQQQVESFPLPMGFPYGKESTFLHWSMTCGAVEEYGRLQCPQSAKTLESDCTLVVFQSVPYNHVTCMMI